MPNETKPFSDGEMKKIKLTQGKIALVDDDDFESLSQFGWHVRKHRHSFYACRNSYMVNGKRFQIQMHREIMGLKHKDGKQVDHINNNGLDNRQENLRVCTNQQNSFNQSALQKSSGFKGVSWYKRYQKWVAQIKYNGRQKCLGYFNSETTAAKAYDKAAIKYFGDFAKLNFGG